MAGQSILSSRVHDLRKILVFPGKFRVEHPCILKLLKDIQHCSFNAAGNAFNDVLIYNRFYACGHKFTGHNRFHKCCRYFIDDLESVMKERIFSIFV